MFPSVSLGRALNKGWGFVENFVVETKASLYLEPGKNSDLKQPWSEKMEP